MATLNESLATWRSSNQSSNLTSKLNINGTLYNIKDPGLEALAEIIEERLTDAEQIRETELTKTATEKFATSVTQGTDGQISVTYSNLRDTALSDTETSGQFVTSVSQDVNGVVTTTKGAVAAENVTFSETNWAATNSKAAILEALSKAIGSASDNSSADTINAAKKYAKELVDTLAGEDIESAAKTWETIKTIVTELNDNTAEGGIGNTILDKLVTLTNGLDYTYTPVSSGTSLIAGETYYTYDENANAYTAIEATGAEDTDNITYYTRSDKTVKEYVDQAVAAVDASSQITTAINALDATVGSTTVDTGKHVAVQVVEADGVLTGITITEDDIASASDLEELETTVENNAYTTSAALNDLNSRTTTLETSVNAIDLTIKANKAAFTITTVNNWTATYDSNSETVTWTNTETSVYIPSGNAL